MKDEFSIIDSANKKMMFSEDANYVFNKETGYMQTWGKTLDKDPIKFPAPTILDLEITTICSKLCPFCYKANNPNGKNLSFEDFKKIFKKLPKSITQIAFGVDSSFTSNSNAINMMKYAKKHGIISNVTVAELDSKTADLLIESCGAVAISRYENFDIFANSVKLLTDRGLKQCNAHVLLSEETYDQAIETIKLASTDKRLEKLNAIVFLALKTKGRGESFHALSQDKFDTVVDLCKELNISYGFDSCGSLKFFKSLSNKEFNLYEKLIQPCESTLESAYINVNGEFFPCSFTEGTENWEKGISVLECNDFVKDVWNNKRTEEFRQKLLSSVLKNKFGCRECPIYKI